MTEQSLNEIKQFWNHEIHEYDDIVEVKQMAKSDIHTLIEEIEALNSMAELQNNLSDNDDRLYKELLEDYKGLLDENEILKEEADKWKKCYIQLKDWVLGKINRGGIKMKELPHPQFGHEDERNQVLEKKIEQLKCENANLREADRYTKEYVDDLKVDIKGLEDELDRVFRENGLMRKMLREFL